MILAFDTFYREKTANTTCVEFKHWSDSLPSKTYQENIDIVANYESGGFYKRELPCILSLLKKIDTSNCKAIIIDGFVVLDDNNRFGLGAYLFEKLNKKIPIIGVAKNDFKDINNLRIEVFRGESKKPLFITSKGIELIEASYLIKNMFGQYRIPDLLKIVDSLGRK